MRQRDYAIDEWGKITLDDVTGDGQVDILVERWPGTNHLCGPRQVFALVNGRAHDIYRHDFCETYWKVADGTVLFDQAWYRRGDSLCCPSFRHKFGLRWNGQRMVRVQNQLLTTKHAS